MAEPAPSSVPLPDVGPLGDDARVALALHGLADVREQLLSAQRTLTGSIAELSAIADGARPPLDPA